MSYYVFEKKKGKGARWRKKQRDSILQMFATHLRLYQVKASGPKLLVFYVTETPVLEPLFPVFPGLVLVGKLHSVESCTHNSKSVIPGTPR